MYKLTLIALLFVTDMLVSTRQAPCQAASTKYEVGTIMAVTPHRDTPTGCNSLGDRFDVSVRVRNKVYTVLYTSPDPQNSVTYHVGTDALVLVEKDTLRFSNKFSPKTTSVPILRVENLPDKPTIDWSKANGQYFSMKMQNLTEKLNLSEEQLAKIKPIAEQESGEVSAVCFTPTVPRKERFESFERIVKSSDAKMRPILSPTQWETLLQLRKEQKQELRKLMANVTER